MRLLLLNNNPAVSRLLKLSVEKVGYEIDEFEDYGLVPLKSYDIIMVDNELYDETEVAALKEQTHSEYCIYVCQRGLPKPDGCNVSLEKPFLPTDFLSLLDKVKHVIESKRAENVSEILLDDNETLEEMENHEDESVGAFDIDSLRAFETEEDDLLGSIEDTEELDSEDEKAELLDKEENESEVPTFDLDTKDEEELELSFVDIPDTEDDDFDTKNLISEEEIESAPSVLDKDDIDEVKQLLNDDDETEEAFRFEEVNLEDNEESVEDEPVTLSFEDDEEKPLSEPFAFDETVEVTEDEEELSFDTPLENKDVETEEEMLMEENPTLENQEEIIDDFAEAIEETTDDAFATTVSDEIISVPVVASNEISSLDELSETILKKAFGEEVEEESIASEPVAVSHEIEVIRGEIENSIERSLAGFAKSDLLREALKGMKINISITFDDKN